MTRPMRPIWHWPAWPGSAANDSTVLTTSDMVSAVVTAAVSGMRYPEAELPERYALGLRTAVFCSPSELSDAAVLLEIQDQRE